MLVDDYESKDGVHRAGDDYRVAHGIDEPLVGTGDRVYWRGSRCPSPSD